MSPPSPWLSSQEGDFQARFNFQVGGGRISGAFALAALKPLKAVTGHAHSIRFATTPTGLQLLAPACGVRMACLRFGFGRADAFRGRICRQSSFGRAQMSKNKRKLSKEG